MKRHCSAVLIAALALAFSGIVGIGSASALPANHTTTSAAASGGVPAVVGGQGRSTSVRSVNLRKLAASPQRSAAGRKFGTLGRNGKPTAGSLPARPATGHKSATASTRSPLIPPTTVNSNFTAIDQPNSNCGCQPPDVNAAVGQNEIVEAVNLRMQVYTKAGATLCGTPLSSFFPGQLSDPRVQYDNAFGRYSLSVIPVPASATATPTLFLATSQTNNPCGSWWLFTITFSGAMYPPGTLLDYPYLGQDRDATSPSLLLSSNNFCCAPNFASYIGSAAFWIPKSAAYSGAGFSFSSFNVAFSTAPVTVSGIPMAVTSSSYFVASVPGTGYNLYRKSGGTLVLQATISSPFNAPTRQVTQGTGLPGLDPLDGRIVWAPVLTQGAIWFTHGLDISGFPGVRYGVINTATNTAAVALAFHSGSSDDFNPSIGVADAGSNVRIWLNWAYTDTPAGQPQTSDTINEVQLPRFGPPVDLIGTDLTLRVGTTTSTNSRFGDYSSVAVDPASGGISAVAAQQHFTGGTNWITNIAETTF